MDEMRDRPVAEDEIVVTPEMVDAGEAALQEELGYILDRPIPDVIMKDAVSLIYRKMKMAKA